MNQMVKNKDNKNNNNSSNSLVLGLSPMAADKNPSSNMRHFSIGQGFFQAPTIQFVFNRSVLSIGNRNRSLSHSVRSVLSRLIKKEQ